jgi:hypothetical protein
MSKLSTRARKRMLAVAAVAGVATSMSLVNATSAHAAGVPTGATGTTVLVIGGPAVATLAANGCGAVTVTGNNGASATQTAKNQWKITLHINEIDVNGNGGIELKHQGSIELQNSCYDITLAALRITNYGNADQFTTFDLNAVLHSPDDTQRYVVGELDLTDAQLSSSGNKVRITKENLYLAPEGAEEFNELATGDPFATGPFFAGEKIGNGKTTVVFTY